jgi:hypothetical protein
MRLVASVLRTLAGAALLAAPQLHADDDAPWLRLRWHDPTRAFPFPSEPIADELRTVLAPAGLDFEWRTMESGEVARASGVDVVLLRDIPRGAVPEGTLGVVQRSGSAPPAAWLLLDNLRRMLGLVPLERALQPAEAALVARAAGRILAHELIHLMAPRLPHAGSGLMRASLGRAQLLGSDPPILEQAVLQALRPALAASALPRPVRAGVELVAGDGRSGA